MTDKKETEEVIKISSSRKTAAKESTVIQEPATKEKPAAPNDEEHE